MIRAVVLLAIVVTLAAAARSFLPEESASLGSGAMLALGFMLLASIQSGIIFAGIRLPRLTGYLVFGFVVGPSISNLVTERMLHDLKLVNGVAIGLIALSAGGELNFRKIRQRLAAVVATSAGSLLFAVVAIGLAVMALSPLLPFTDGMSLSQRAVVALTIGVTFAALSPAVTIALISETGAAGPISDTSLGIVVVADLVIVLSFAAVKALAGATFATGEGSGAVEVMVHIFGSITVGLVLGIVFLVYLKKINQHSALFIVGICFLCAEAGKRLHLDPLLMCLTAGLFLENLTDIEGSKLVHEIQPASMPVFAVFFAVAGAGLHWDSFRRIALVAVILAAVRATALYLGGRLGMALGRVPPQERKYLHYTLYSQSGVAIGLAILVKAHFPGWGAGAGDCILGGVMINELIGPILFKSALTRSGEAGKRATQAAAH